MRDGADYVLNGRKWWTSGAGDPRSKIAIFMGKSNPEAPRHQQHAMVLVPMDTPGVKIRRMLNVFGYDEAPHGHGEVVFENVRVPVSNMLLGEGVFVDFFGHAACTTSGPARIARRTGVPVVLGLVIWDEKLKKYRLRFDAVEWIQRDDPEEEIVANTAHFTKLIEEYVRRYPDQWLWVHRRWKTRPPGEPSLYSC